MTLAEEKELLENARIQPSAFGPAYDLYYDKIFGYVMRRTGHYETARDITADTFLKAVLALPRYEWRGLRISSWLFQIATNELRQYFRKQKYYSRVFGELPERFVLEKKLHGIFEEERRKVEAIMSENEAFANVSRLMRNLDLKYQEALTLRYFEQKSVREIAEILSKNEGTVKSLLSRGMEKLSALYQKTLGTKEI